MPAFNPFGLLPFQLVLYGVVPPVIDKVVFPSKYPAHVASIVTADDSSESGSDMLNIFDRIQPLSSVMV